MFTVDSKLQALSRLVYQLTGITFFLEFPAEELSSVATAVTDEDSFRARVTDTCNLMDRINKAEIDKRLKLTTKGTRECFVFLLKHLSPRQHNMIEEHVVRPLGLLSLLRDFLTHRKHKAIDKALVFFELTLPIQHYSEAWEKVFFRFKELIDASINVLSSVNYKTDFKQVEIDTQLRTVLEQQLIRRFRRLLEDDNVKKLLLYLLAEGRITDNALSILFGLDLFDLRQLLLPLVPHVLSVSYYDMNWTSIEVRESAVVLLKSFYFSEQK